MEVAAAATTCELRPQQTAVASVTVRGDDLSAAGEVFAAPGPAHMISFSNFGTAYTTKAGHDNFGFAELAAFACAPEVM
jgi:hypothetical protein